MLRVVVLLDDDPSPQVGGPEGSGAGFHQGSPYTGPPGWRSGLRHCITVLAVPPERLGKGPGSVAAGHDREAHRGVRNWPSIVRVRECLAGRDILVSSRTSDSRAGRAQCTLTRSPGVQCFL